MFSIGHRVSHLQFPQRHSRNDLFDQLRETRFANFLEERDARRFEGHRQHDAGIQFLLGIRPPVHRQRPVPETIPTRFAKGKVDS